MKQRAILVYSSISIFLFYFSCTSPEKLIKLQENYIPSTIAGIYIGMPIKALKENRGGQNLSMTKKGDVTILKEECAKDSITLFQYHFNKKRKLSKIIIDYFDTYEIYDAYKTKLGEPNSGKAWLIAIDKKLKLLIWTQQHILCIADYKQFKN